VVEESFAGIARLNPEINRIIPVAMRRWKRALASQQTWREFMAFRHDLRSEQYDAILDTQGLLKSAMVCYWARGKSHGQNQQTAHEVMASYVYNHRHDIPRELHAVTRNRLLGALALGYPLPDSPPAYNLQVPDMEVPALALNAGILSNYVMGVHGTARDAKLWPVESWISLAEHLSSLQLSLLLPWGNADEHRRAQAIASKVPRAVVLPKMGLTELAALISKAKAVIGVDTGLMHMAVALKIPTLAIFTDTHIWQAGAYPSADSAAITIGGKPAQPTVSEAILALQQLLGDL
jgi:heptosyltransferase I